MTSCNCPCLQLNLYPGLLMIVYFLNRLGMLILNQDDRKNSCLNKQAPKAFGLSNAVTCKHAS